MRAHSGSLRLFEIFRMGRGLSPTFTLLILLIVCGNALIIWEFSESSSQIEMLTSTGRQLSLVLQLQQSLLFLHQRLDELTQANDWAAIENEAPKLSQAVIEQAHLTRTALNDTLARSATSFEFLPALDAIEISVPAQVDSILALARHGDREVLRLRLAKQLLPLELQSASLVTSLNQQIRGEMDASIKNVRPFQRKILFLVPATTLATFLIASFFGWAMTQRMARVRFEERVDERARIARELHDTLMQTVEGCRMIAEAAATSVETSPADPRLPGQLAELLRRASEEGRAAMQTLRAVSEDTMDLYADLSRFSDEMAASGSPRISIVQPGRSRVFRPGVREEVLRISCEAIRNACRHARASLIVVTIHQDGNLRVLIKDDGTGIAPSVLSSGKDKRYGLQGMRERAQSLGGRLTVTVDSGTLVSLVVPESTAFLPKARGTRNG